MSTDKNITLVSITLCHLVWVKDLVAINNILLFLGLKVVEQGKDSGLKILLLKGNAFLVTLNHNNS